MAALLVCCLTACHQHRSPSQNEISEEDRWQATDEAAVRILQQSVAASRQHSGVIHVVLCWLKTPGDDAARKKIIDASNQFKTIPGVASVTAGRPIPSTRPVVDSSFDVAVVINFADEAAMAAYEQNPIHKKAVSDVLRPLTAKILIYDIARVEGATTR